MICKVGKPWSRGGKCPLPPEETLDSYVSSLYLCNAEFLGIWLEWLRSLLLYKEMKLNIFKKRLLI